MTAPSSPLPQALLDRWLTAFGDDHVRVVAATLTPAATVFRVNTLKIRPDEAIAQLQQQGIEVFTLNALPDAWRVNDADRQRLTDTDLFLQGHIYIQNASSMLPSRVLNPDRNDKVLDLAAAPGSKTLMLSELMSNEGWISAVEVVKDRFFRLKSNLDKHGAENVHTYHTDGTRVWKKVPEQFDKVLLDAPCSSEAQIKSDNPESWRYWSPNKIKDMTRKQKMLMYSAVQCLKPGGVLVYSTCTYAPEENEGIVNYALKKFGDALETEDIAMDLPGVMPIVSQWGRDRYSESVQRAVRVAPDREFEGFFICKLRKRRSTA